MYRSLCFVFFCISVVVTERLNYPPIQVIGDEATLQHIEARRLMSIAEVERLDNLELLARERVALEQERQQSASQLFRRLREETEAEMLFEEAKLEALSAEEQSPISRTRENERELLEPAGVYDNYDQGYGQSPYNSNNNNNRYNDDSRFPNSNENVGSGYPSNNGNVGYNHPSTSNNYGNNLPSNNNNNYGNNYPRNTNNNYGNSNNNNYDNSYPGGNSYPSGNANYDNSYPNNLNDNRYPGNTNMNQNNNRHPIGSGSGSWGNSNNNNIGTGSGGWGNNNNGQWGNNGGRGQVCCQSCHTGDINCLSTCDRICKKSHTCSKAGEGAYAAFCQESCPNVIGGLSATTAYIPLKACEGECAAQVQELCSAHSCRDYGCVARNCQEKAPLLCRMTYN